ncbi:hypothetical protein HBO23_21445 [Pseudomonas sp. WS 5532]|uniref:hypothetical protein n=1 Tax=Pseudomonas TaxID=286 RepID=UPI00147534E2|nr:MULTISPECIES: hypothetical protein [Pseudomonas]MCF5140511.1 hypothetical protein [Pseudomonas sp. PA-6-3C]MCF5148875.1 hypothetical protein [Pseudomonas sp. PA-6-3F]MCF5157893.1 hypothetical protein [Pseudomonas sp. PA-6-2E]MCF5174506.1 hypothetical protein [Pseudomonas sp. PA-6-1D]MCF5194203.1 hypothetical protein [Pseudomonas sp. PA-6-1H]
MDTHNKGSLSLLLISCALSASVSVPVLAAGDGVIVVERQVQPYAIGRSRGQDPYPNTVNANPSAQVNRAMNHELSDNDIAGISSGSSITRSIMPNGDITGLNSLGGANNLGAAGAAAHGSSGSGIAGTVNGAISSGLAPLNNISGMVGGAMK